MSFYAFTLAYHHTLTLFNLIASHLDTSGTTVRVLFMDFSSAFNTIQPHVLIKKLLNLEVNPDLILWIRQCLCDRPQRVRLNGSLSRYPVLSDEVIVMVCQCKCIERHMQL